MKKVIFIFLVFLIFSCTETSTEKLEKKVEIGQKRDDIIKKIGYCNFSYISNDLNIVDTYNNESQFEAPLILIYDSKDSTLLRTTLDW